MFKKLGFTLAEVLITLGIIGVIAAITIPNVIQNSNGVKYRAAFKKGISTLSQAALTSSAQYNLDYGNANSACSGDYEYSAEHNLSGTEYNSSFCYVLSRTLSAAKFNIAATSKARNAGGNASAQYSFASTATLQSAGNYRVYTLADGMIVGFKAASKASAPCKLPKGQVLTSSWITNHPNCRGFIDVNGVNLPNREVTCSSGGTSTNLSNPCTVNNTARNMTDVYPIVFHNTVVEPASNAAAYVLQTAK